MSLKPSQKSTASPSQSKSPSQVLHQVRRGAVPVEREPAYLAYQADPSRPGRGLSDPGLTFVTPQGVGSVAPAPAAKSEPPLPFEELVGGWASERRPTQKTLYEWRRVLRQLAAFIGHDDARRLRPEDMIAWKQSLVEAGQHPKTIRDAKISPVRAILKWAVDNRYLSANPAERVTIDVKVKASEAKRSFTDEEAAIVLKAALREKDPVRRWVPWLCAYSGARLSE